MTDEKIIVETRVAASLEVVWQVWTTPADIEQWNNASSDWHTPRAEIDLREGGRFWSWLESKDGSMGFDFTATYSRVEPQGLIEYTMEGGREVSLALIDHGDGRVSVCERFDSEATYSREQQQQGRQAILDKFKRHVESISARRG